MSLLYCVPAVEAKKAMVLFVAIMGEPVPWPSAEELEAGKEESLERLRKFKRGGGTSKEECTGAGEEEEEDDNEGGEDKAEGIPASPESEEDEEEEDEEDYMEDAEGQAMEGCAAAQERVEEQGQARQEEEQGQAIQEGKQGEGGAEGAGDAMEGVLAEALSRDALLAPEMSPQPPPAQEPTTTPPAPQADLKGQGTVEQPRKRRKITQELDCWIVNKHIQQPQGDLRCQGLSFFKKAREEALRLKLMEEDTCTS